jgi:uncharacterized protein (DUF1800 family)
MTSPAIRPASGLAWPVATACAAAAVLLAACSAAPPREAPTTAPVDAAWLGRLTYGLDSATARRYGELGRDAFLDAELHPKGAALAPEVVVRIDALGLDTRDATSIVMEIAREQQRLRDLAEGMDREQARKALNERGNAQAAAAAQREILRALYSRHQLQEQMTWFWLNHFSVYANKAQLRWLVADYAEHAIRPHVLGHFRDLVLATLKHPAMLEYLDNAQNAVGHPNENYARELMELHTLGVDAGYRQQDVQELARVLTGVGVVGRNGPATGRRGMRALIVQEGGFEFHPGRHDFGDKLLLGHSIRGEGFAEVEKAVLILTRDPACARFISRKLATAFVADDPPAPLVESMAARFRATDGDIAAVLRTMFTSADYTASLGHKFRDPMQYVVGAVRLAYDGQYIANPRPVLNWLNGLGEPLFGRQTPDGYPLTQLGWASSGQLSRRFEIARAIASGNAGLFKTDADPAPAAVHPHLASPLYFSALEPNLAPATRSALAQANSPQEWNALLLASPEFNFH